MQWKSVTRNWERMTKVSHKNIDESLKPVIPLKFSSVSNRYNQLLLDFKGGYSVEFRAFNDGIAYRFITNKQTDILKMKIKSK